MSPQLPSFSLNLTISEFSQCASCTLLVWFLLEFWVEPSTLLAFPIWYCYMAASLQDSTYIYSCIYAVSTSSVCPNTTRAQTNPLLLLLCCGISNSFWVDFPAEFTRHASPENNCGQPVNTFLLFVFTCSHLSQLPWCSGCEPGLDLCLFKAFKRSPLEMGAGIANHPVYMLKEG